MAHFLLKPSVVIAAAFAVVIALIRARPYDGQPLHALFLPENCHHPCWQQIRPGVTTLDEALAILRADAWIDGVDIHGNIINWYWSGRQPALLNASVPGELLIYEQRVLSVRVQLNAGFGDLQLTFGQPHWTSAGKFRHAVRVQFTYPDDYLTMSMVLECPMDADSFWRSRPEITLNHLTRAGSSYSHPNQFLKRC